MLDHPLAIVTTVVATALAAGLLTPVIRTYVPPHNVWFRLRSHVVLAAAGGLGANVVAEDIIEMVALAAAAVGCAVLMVIDLAVHRLPDPIVGGTWAILVLALTVGAAMSSGWENIGRVLLASLALLLGYFVLAFISPAGLGLGDVKFAAVIGALLGWFGWQHVALGTVLGFLINGFIAAVALILTRRLRNAEVPFGPSMVLGAILAVALLS